MKRKILACASLFLAASLLYGCAKLQPVSFSQSESEAPALSSSVSAPAPDELLLKLQDALNQSDPVENYQIEFTGHPEAEGQRVELASGVLAALAGILDAADAERASVKTYSGADDSQSILIQGGQPYLSIQLYRLSTASTDPARDATMLWLQVGEEDSQYFYGPETYEKVYGLLSSHFVKDAPVLSGDYVLLEEPSAPGTFLDTVFVEDWLEEDDAMAALYGWYGDEGGKSAAIEFYSTKDGGSLQYKEYADGALFMEATDYGEADVRVVLANGAIEYWDAENPTKPLETATLPSAVKALYDAPLPQDRPVFRSFDGGPDKDDLWAVTDEAGIHYTPARGEALLTIPNEDILPALPREMMSDDPEVPAPQFADVRIMNDGETLVATVMLPMSQMGSAGLVAVHIPTGASEWYFGMFRPMIGFLDYVDDETLVVSSEDLIYKISFDEYSTGQMTETPAPKDIALAASHDYERYIFRGEVTADDGSKSAILHMGDPEAPLLTSTDSYSYEDLLLAGVTEDYAIALAKMEGRCRVILVPLPNED